MSGMSEDSDYTSDINYPLSHQHNSSAHQFRGEPNYPLNRDNSRDYNTDYGQYDSFEGDEYDHRRSFERMDTYDRAGSFEREIGYEERDSFERRNYYDHDYDDREDGDYFHSDEDYEDERDSDRRSQDYDRRTQSYDRRIQDYVQDYDERMVHDYDGEEIGSQSSIRDYDSEREFERSDRDYERTITNRDSLTHDRVYDIFDSPDYPQESRKYSVESSRKYSSDSRKISQGSRDSRTEANEYSRESDYFPNGSPYHIGRSDTDSEPLSYNSRPNTRPPLSNIANTYGSLG